MGLCQRSGVVDLGSIGKVVWRVEDWNTLPWPSGKRKTGCTVEAKSWMKVMHDTVDKTGIFKSSIIVIIVIIIVMIVVLLCSSPHPHRPHRPHRSRFLGLNLKPF